MNIVKKLSIGAWVSVITAVLILVALIVYGVNVGGEGYFQNRTITNYVLFCILSVVALLAVVALSLVDLKGSAAMGVEIVSGLLQIVVPLLLAFCLINLIAGRVEGLGFIYFSNEDVKTEVQTAANMASASSAITSMVFTGIATVASMVAAFFTVKKKA